jgi:hypothetical protein
LFSQFSSTFLPAADCITCVLNYLLHSCQLHIVLLVFSIIFFILASCRLRYLCSQLSSTFLPAAYCVSCALNYLLHSCQLKIALLVLSIIFWILASCRLRHLCSQLSSEFLPAADCVTCALNYLLNSCQLHIVLLVLSIIFLILASCILLPVLLIFSFVPARGILCYLCSQISSSFLSVADCYLWSQSSLLLPASDCFTCAPSFFRLNQWLYRTTTPAVRSANCSFIVHGWTDRPWSWPR